MYRLHGSRLMMSKLAVLFIEGMPRNAGPLEPMTPLAGVIDEKLFEQRITTIDLSSNTVKQVTPADMYVYEYDWSPMGAAGPRSRHKDRATTTGGSRDSTVRTAQAAKCKRSTIRSNRSPCRMFLPMGSRWRSLKD